MDREGLPASAGHITGSLEAPEAAVNRRRRSRVFSASCGIGVLLAIVGLPRLTRSMEASRFRADHSQLGALPVEWYDKSAITPTEADRKHEFWLSESWAERGVALRLLQVPELFESFFPGYREAIADESLWADYFADQPAWSPIQSPRTSFGAFTNYAIRLRLAGSMKMFAKYGADVLVLGASKTFCAVIPRVLADSLRGVAGPDPKVLLVGSDAVGGSDVSRIADAFAPTGHRVRLAILSGSWRDWQGGSTEIEQQVDRALDGRARGAIFSAAGLRQKLVWRRWIGTQLVPVTSSVQLPFAPLGAGATVYAMPLPRVLVRFPKALRNDPRSLGTLSSEAAAVALTHRPEEFDADLSHTEASIDQTIASVRRIADRVLLFFPPEAIEMDAAMPTQYIARFRRMLRAKAARDVAILEDGREAYGLTQADYVHAASDDASLLVSDHLNYSGALKIEGRLAELARAVMR